MSRQDLHRICNLTCSNLHFIDFLSGIEKMFGLVQESRVLDNDSYKLTKGPKVTESFIATLFQIIWWYLGWQIIISRNWQGTSMLTDSCCQPSPLAIWSNLGNKLMHDIFVSWIWHLRFIHSSQEFLNHEDQWNQIKDLIYLLLGLISITLHPSVVQDIHPNLHKQCQVC